MMGPSELPSTDSLDGWTVETPDNNDTSALVCSAGCGGARCTPHCAQRFATARWYVATLLALALTLGAVRGYTAALAHVIGERYALPPAAIDWLLVGAEAAQGATALLLAHGGARSHRPSWLGGPAFLHAGACFAALVPFVTPHGVTHGPMAKNATEWLCERNARVVTSEAGQPCWLTLVTMVMVQVSAGVASSSLLTNGVTYLDDNVASTDIPSLLGAVLGADRMGPPLGQVFAYLCATASGSATGHVVAGGQLSGIWWLGWPMLGSMLVALALLVSMFPVRLPAAAVRERANCILKVACGRVRIDDQPIDIDEEPGLIPSLKRLLTNKVLSFTMLFLMFLYTPLFNFTRYENRYLESVYFIPEPEYSGGVFKDAWTSRVTTGFLKPPIVLMTMLLSGMIISRKRPRPSSLALWNAVMVLITAILFLTFSFLGCANTVRGLQEDSLKLVEKCNLDCSCPGNIPFLPICDRHEVESYYSPCHAGCDRVEYLDNIKLYYDCKCLKYDRRAKGGACSDSNCTSKWVVFQSLGVIISGLIGSCMVGSILLCLRSVSPQDKTIALGFVLMHIGITHLPGHIVYKLATDATCIYWGENNYNCQLFDPQILPFAFHLLTVGFLLISFFFAMFAWNNSKNIKLFHDEFDEPDAMEMNEIRRKLNARLSTPFTKRKRKSRNDSNSSDDEEGESNHVSHMQSLAQHDVNQDNERQRQSNENNLQENSDTEYERQPLQENNENRRQTNSTPQRINESMKRTNENNVQENSDTEYEQQPLQENNENRRQTNSTPQRIWRATLI